MGISQHLTGRKLFTQASLKQRIAAFALFCSIACFFGLFLLEAAGRLDLQRFLTPCGFKQRYNIPCPTCGITTAVRAFSHGRVLDAFYIQPAGALLCVLLLLTAFLALTTALCGVYFTILQRLLTEVRVRYFVLAAIIVLAAAWSVTLARSFAEKK
jgi:hypothetical protein